MRQLTLSIHLYLYKLCQQEKTQASVDHNVSKMLKKNIANTDQTALDRVYRSSLQSSSIRGR